MRILIMGWPNTGKSTLAKRMAKELGLEHFCTDPQAMCPEGVKGIPNDLDWSAGSQWVASHLLGREGLLIEGVALPRALRKWREANPNKNPPADKILILKNFYVLPNKGQQTMGKGHDKVLGEIMGWIMPLIERRIHALESPGCHLTIGQPE